MKTKSSADKREQLYMLIRDTNMRLLDGIEDALGQPESDKAERPFEFLKENAQLIGGAGCWSESGRIMIKFMFTEQVSILGKSSTEAVLNITVPQNSDVGAKLKEIQGLILACKDDALKILNREYETRLNKQLRRFSFYS